MSASNSRSRDAIRRIALSDPDIRALLDDFKNRGGIASDSIEIEGAADGRSICCDGKESGSGTPGASIRDPDADGSGQDASDGLGDDPAKIEMGGGSLIGVKDCETGQPVRFMGGSCIPPKDHLSAADLGWTDCQTYDHGFLPGMRWRVQTGAYATADVSMAAAIDGHADTLTQVYNGTYTLKSVESLDKTNQEGASAGIVYQSGDTTREGSVEYYPDENAPSEPPPAPDWPSNGQVDLYLAGGKFVASKYDPEAQGTSYLKGVDSIELCDDYGNSFSLTASGSVEGGWKTIDPSSPGDGYLYNANGEQIARISGSEYADPNV